MCEEFIRLNRPIITPILESLVYDYTNDENVIFEDVNILNDFIKATYNIKMFMDMLTGIVRFDDEWSNDYLKYFDNIFKINAPTSFNHNITIGDDQQIIDCQGYKFITLKKDSCISETIRDGIIYLTHSMWLTSYFINLKKNIIDVGGNIGCVCIPFSTIINPNAVIYSFEPQPVLFDILNKNIIMNKRTNIETYNCGLSDTSCKRYFDKDYSKCDNYGVAILHDSPRDNNSIEVSCETGDSLNLLNIGFIKITNGGGELKTLQGLKITISVYKPVILIGMYIETPDEEKTEILHFLQKLGYNKVLKSLSEIILFHDEYPFLTI
jgi:FkbM family methyltransferase